MTRVMMHSDRDRRRGWERRGDERGRDRYGDRPAKRARREDRSRSRERRRRYDGGGDERREQRQQRRYDGGRDVMSILLKLTIGFLRLILDPLLYNKKESKRL